MNLKKILGILLVVVTVIVMVYLYKANNINKNVIKYEDKQIDAININEDVVGWISINDTNVNYPVLKAKDNDFYLTKNIKKEDSKEGSIFMDYRNIGNGHEKNTIIYGHNMKNGSMFQSITKYKNKEFLDSHTHIEFNTLSEDIKWEVFSVYTTDINFNYIRTKFKNNNDYKNFLTDIKNRSIYYLKVEVSDNDEILTLSTCSYEYDDARFVVHAKKVR